MVCTAYETGASGHTNARSRSNLDSAPPSGERRAAQMDGASFLCEPPPCGSLNKPDTSVRSCLPSIVELVAAKAAAW